MRNRTARLPGLLVALVVAGLLAGCGGSPEAAQEPEPVDTQGLPDDSGKPLEGLPDCDDPPKGEPAAATDVPGLLLPKGAIVTGVERADPLVTVNGYVETTPIRIRQFYQRQKGLKLLEIEDEIYEAEAFYEQGAYRAFVKAQARCSEGSILIAVVGPSGAAPTPTFRGGGG